MATIANIAVAITARTAGLNKGLAGSNRRLGQFGRSVQGIGSRLSGVGAIGGTVFGALSARNIVQTADAWTELRNRLKTVQSTGTGVENDLAGIVRVANEARAPIATIGDAFHRFALFAGAANLSNEQVLGLVDTLTKMGVVGGTTGTALSNSLLQLSQGFASGRLQGDELRSVMENFPVLAQALATQLNVPIGKLKELGSEGAISQGVIIAALQNSAAATQEQFAKLTPTVGQQITVIGNKWRELVDVISNSGSAFSGLLSVLQFISDVLDKIIKIFSREGGPISFIKKAIVATRGGDFGVLERGSAQFFGPNNPLSGAFQNGKLEEARSAEMLAELKTMNSTLSSLDLEGSFVSRFSN